jgi:hypothetical protein
MRLEQEARHHAKVATSPAQRPEEIGVLAFAGRDKTAVGQDYVGFEQVINREAVLACEVPGEPPTVRPATPVVETMPKGTASPNG